METMLFRMVYEQDKPLLGICRGIQYYAGRGKIVM